MKTNGLDSRAKKELEAFLRNRHAELTESVRVVVARRRALEAERSADPANWATATLEDEIQVALMDRQSRQVAQIEAALDRLTRGDYGRCHDCEEFIGLPRLKALPFAQRCNRCQARAEQRARRYAGTARPAPGIAEAA
jgi:DnaK suppressor protein